ncbi:Ammonium transporter MEP2 [Wickerhamiella sorbophila]|uniref:Ammonium transporter n=1 Tax=Wickerhamiella sorbophila TaxID=45607 RepID=A0A2T0FLC8_9ASCO|nr:Ammonium transporter MEP2 [Wickerhamiella sorbophila]PRT55789.1 Ammonium transporter MEP2 [Wickerhamiella sorbophila]
MGSFGGDSLTQNLNTNFQEGDMVWVGAASALVWIMIPGIGFFYAGLSRKKHAISLIFSSLAVCGVGFFQWFFWGYSLVFSHEAGRFLGKLDNFSMMKVLAAPSSAAPAVPDVLFMLFQGMFACTTAALVVGGAHERARLGPMMVFIFIWMTIVYCPIAEWTWNPEGWLAWLGALDFAGGGPVHMSSGAGALAYALVCGKRKDPAAKIIPVYKPGSVLLCVLGTCFLWFGWFGFNGGSTGNASIRSWYAFSNTNIAASVGAMTWLFVDYIRKRKWSTIALCSGAVAGLVGITPCAGMVPLYCAVAVGAITAVACNFAIGLKFLLRIDDGLDVFALHGVGGATGSICTALFTADYITHLDGSTIAQGWMNHHYVQLAYQLAAIGATIGWSFVVTFLILLIMKYTPYMSLRTTHEEEMMGDQAQLAEYEMFAEEDLLQAIGTYNGEDPYPDAYVHQKKEAEEEDSTRMENDMHGMQETPSPV